MRLRQTFTIILMWARRIIPNQYCRSIFPLMTQAFPITPIWAKPEFRRFVMMALGSADEMQVWVMYCRDLGYIGADMAERWQGEYREIARMLSGLYRGGSDN